MVEIMRLYFHHVIMFRIESIIWPLEYIDTHSLLYYFAFIYIRFWDVKYVSFKEKHKYKAYKLYSEISPTLWFFISQVPQPRTTSFECGFPENVIIHTCTSRTDIHILFFFKEILLFCTSHVLQYLDSLPHPI